MKDILTSIFGANWRTTISGNAVVILLAIQTSPQFLPQDWHNVNQILLFLAWCAGIISGSAFSFHAKDSAVSGNGTQNAPQKIANPDGSNTVLPPLSMVALFAIAGTFLGMVAGCATDTGNPSKDRAGRVTNASLAILERDVANVAWNSLKAAGSQWMDDKKIDLAYSAQQGLYASSQSIVTSDDLKNLINAWTGNQLPSVAAQAAQSFADQHPNTSADVAKVVDKIAATIGSTADAARDSQP